MKIIQAKDYGFRKVIRVLLNPEDPEDPESLHSDGQPHAVPAPKGTPKSLKPWEWCHDYRYNWQVKEYVWTGEEELYILDESGGTRLKTNDDLIEEIKESLRPQPAPSDIYQLIDLTLSNPLS